MSNNNGHSIEIKYGIELYGVSGWINLHTYRDLDTAIETIGERRGSYDRLKLRLVEYKIETTVIDETSK